MKKRLLLSGPIGCGKSTLIRNALGDRIKRAGGFLTERITGSDGTLVGFDLIAVAAVSAPSEAREGRRFLSFENGGAARDNRVFRNEAVRLLSEAKQHSFAVLDEFGGYELLIPEFTAALFAFLQSDIPCVGVLKTPDAAKTLLTRVALPGSYLSLAEQLRAALERDPNTEILETTGRNDTRAETALKNWVEEYTHV